MAIECEAWKYTRVRALVKNECCNYLPNKSSGPHACLRTWRDAAGNLHCDETPCTLVGTDHPEPCAYFERSLLPAVPTVKGKKPLLQDYARMFAEFATPEAAKQWKKWHEGDYNRCECGQAVGPHRKKCDACRESSRREATRREKRRQRGAPAFQGVSCPTDRSDSPLGT
jgi:hypothetical protein